MKKYIYMAVAAIAALSSCSSDNDPIIEEPGKQALTFTATMEGDDTTARALYNSTNKCAQWETNDTIKINGVLYNAQGAGLTTTFKAATQGQDAQGSTYNAYFACTYDGTTASLPAEVSETWADDKFNMPMYATSTTTNLKFKNLCGVLKITVKSSQIDKVKKIKVSSKDKAISGAFTVTSNAAALTAPTTVANTLTITYANAVSTDTNGKVFYVAVPAQTYQELKIELDADGNGFTKSMTTKASTNITVERNKIYPITFADNAVSLPAGALLGKFTIDSEDNQVHFSKGNLQVTYNNGGYTFGFAANQYDRIGKARGNTTITTQSQADGDVADLFGWSTSKTTYGVSTSADWTTYTGDFVDWGTAIDSNGTWRTLTQSEWDYLIKTRSASTVNGIDNARYATATVNGIPGLLLLPDSYTHPADVSALVATNINCYNMTTSSAISYSTDEWAKLESAGVVFLPVTGQRRDWTVNYEADYAYYWASTSKNDSNSYHLRVDNSYVRTSYTSRYLGIAVRLVTNAE